MRVRKYVCRQVASIECGSIKLPFRMTVSRLRHVRPNLTVGLFRRQAGKRAWVRFYECFFVSSASPHCRYLQTVIQSRMFHPTADFGGRKRDGTGLTQFSKSYPRSVFAQSTPTPRSSIPVVLSIRCSNTSRTCSRICSSAGTTCSTSSPESPGRYFRIECPKKI